MTALLHYSRFSHSPNEEKATTIAKPALLILHGLLGSGNNWRTQAKKLSTDRTVLTADLRNHGQSPHLKGMSYREMYSDIENLADKLGLKSFDLMGHSMGGKVAMQLALNRPERIRRLIVVDIAPKTYPLWHQSLLQGMLNCPLEKMNERSQIDDYLSEWIQDSHERGFLLKNLKQSRSVNKTTGHSAKQYTWQSDIEEIARNYLKIAGFPETGHAFQSETLFIRGEHSPYIQLADQANIDRHFPHNAIITLKESGHLPHFEQPDLFFSAVKTFLDSA